MYTVPSAHEAQQEETANHRGGALIVPLPFYTAIERNVDRCRIDNPDTFCYKENEKTIAKEQSI